MRFSKCKLEILYHMYGVHIRNASVSEKQFNLKMNLSVKHWQCMWWVSPISIWSDLNTWKECCIESITTLSLLTWILFPCFWISPAVCVHTHYSPVYCHQSVSSPSDVVSGSSSGRVNHSPADGPSQGCNAVVLAFNWLIKSCLWVSETSWDPVISPWPGFK